MRPYFICHSEHCDEHIAVNCKAGSFCREHYEKWQQEVRASGGSDADVAGREAKKCRVCNYLQPCEMQSGLCYDCEMNMPSGSVQPRKYRLTRYHSSVDHPAHYTGHPSGIECITITEHMGFCLGNAIKYIWRADGKGGIEDLEKARWYITREIERKKAND